MDQSRVLVGAIDQGTSSSRFLLFDAKTHELICHGQRVVKNIYPKAGWVEVDGTELLTSVHECIQEALEHLTSQLHIHPSCVKAIGLSNQRETTVAFNISTGRPLHNAISWMDARTSALAERLLQAVPGGDQNHFKHLCGLPISNYASALKMLWLLNHSSAVQEAIDRHHCRFVTIDTWILWNLTGGVEGGVLKTDVSNASRTGLLDINSLQWHPRLLDFYHLKECMLADVASSCEKFGRVSAGVLQGIPITAILGDQMAALIGHKCLSYGQTKNTYGSGCFMLCNTGTKPLLSTHGLLTSVAYQLGPQQPAHYVLEGSIAVAGQAINWLRDKMQLVTDFQDLEEHVRSVEDSGGCYFVPAFTGLLCPHWNHYARGLICGLSQTTTKAHLIRACLDAICFQTKDVAEAMARDVGEEVRVLHVDGGVSANDFLMQLQANVLGIPVARSSMLELTALGVASVAAAAVGLFSSSSELFPSPQNTKDCNNNDNISNNNVSSNSNNISNNINNISNNISKNSNNYKNTAFEAEQNIFHPRNTQQERDDTYAKWKEAVKRSFDWEVPKLPSSHHPPSSHS